jgi:hypothetical protein
MMHAAQKIALMAPEQSWPFFARQNDKKKARGNPETTDNASYSCFLDQVHNIMSSD